MHPERNPGWKTHEALCALDKQVLRLHSRSIREISICPSHMVNHNVSLEVFTWHCAINFLFVLCMVGPLKTAVLVLSEHPLPNQCLLHLHVMHRAGVSVYLPHYFLGTVLHNSYVIYLWLFPDGSDSKESTCNAGDLGLIPGLGRFPEGGHGHLHQYSCLENGGLQSMGSQSWTWLAIKYSRALCLHPTLL